MFFYIFFSSKMYYAGQNLVGEILVDNYIEVIKFLPNVVSSFAKIGLEDNLLALYLVQ